MSGISLLTLIQVRTGPMVVLRTLQDVSGPATPTLAHRAPKNGWKYSYGSHGGCQLLLSLLLSYQV